MVTLPDVNVLVALAWPNHVHHRAARSWFAVNRDLGWRTCPITQIGFVRLSANPRVTAGTATAADAVEVLRNLVGRGTHDYLIDDVDLLASDGVLMARVQGYRQVTDAHLLAVARRHGAALVTFDRGAAGLDPSGRNTVLLQS